MRLKVFKIVVCWGVSLQDRNLVCRGVFCCVVYQTLSCNV